MSLQIRPYVAEDYETLASWWKSHGWEPVRADILPRLGVVAELDGKAIGAAFLYMDNSVGVCWMEWLVTAPQAGLTGIRAIRAITDFLSAEAKRRDYGVMITSCRQEALVRVYEKAGFIKTDVGVTHLIKITGGN